MLTYSFNVLFCRKPLLILPPLAGALVMTSLHAPSHRCQILMQHRREVDLRGSEKVAIPDLFCKFSITVLRLKYEGAAAPSTFPTDRLCFIIKLTLWKRNNRSASSGFAPRLHKGLCLRPRIGLYKASFDYSGIQYVVSFYTIENRKHTAAERQ